MEKIVNRYQFEVLAYIEKNNEKVYSAKTFADDLKISGTMISKCVEELVEKVATKRYTKARVRRILTYILVGAMDQALPDAIHVLGFSAKGQAHLKGLKKSVEIVTRIGKEPWDALTQQADQVYQLGHPQLPEQIWGRVPVRVEDQ